MFEHQSLKFPRNHTASLHQESSNSSDKNFRGFQPRQLTQSYHIPFKSHENSRSHIKYQPYDRKARLYTYSSNHESTPFINFNFLEKPHFVNPHLNLSVTEQNFDRCKSQLIRAQSMNSIYSTQKIQMLTKINSILENHSFQGSSNVLNPEQAQQKTKSSLRKEMHAKIDRLESYLFKIKHQRQKQKVPKLQVESQTHKNQNNRQLTVNTESKNQGSKISDVFKELDKLKKQIGRVRDQAIQVRNRNSVSREKTVRKIEIDHNLMKIKEQMAKINSLQSKMQSESSAPTMQLNSSKNQFPVQNIPTQRYLINSRLNNHISSFQSQKAPVYLPSQRNPNQIRTIDPRSMSKPKITFSFASKT